MFVEDVTHANGLMCKGGADGPTQGWKLKHMIKHMTNITCIGVALIDGLSLCLKFNLC